MPDQNPSAKPDDVPRGKSEGSGEAKPGKEDDEKTAEEWFAGVGAGMKGVSRKLWDQIPPDLREKVAEQARSHGPGSAAVLVEGAALKARGFKAKFALKGLAKLLRVLDSRIPKK